MIEQNFATTSDSTKRYDFRKRKSEKFQSKKRFSLKNI